jgi:cell division control protein 24
MSSTPSPNSPLSSSSRFNESANTLFSSPCVSLLLFFALHSAHPSPLSQSLLKNTPQDHQYHNELKAGLDSIQRVTEKVNEEKRRKDNLQSVSDLANRVEDWKGHDIASFGELLLQETFIVIKSENEREYNVYLFERIILCCKEVGATGKKDKKSNSILKRPPSQRINKLQLKGRIFVNNITGATQVNHRSGSYSLLRLSRCKN